MPTSFKTVLIGDSGIRNREHVRILCPTPYLKIVSKNLYWNDLLVDARALIYMQSPLADHP